MEQQIPSFVFTVLRPWLSMYRSTPKIYLPFISSNNNNVDIGFALRWAIQFSILRLAFRCALHYLLGWPLLTVFGTIRSYDYADDAQQQSSGGSNRSIFVTSNSLVSFCHSMLIVPALFAILLSQKYDPSGKLDTSPLWYQDATSAVLQFCTGYMIYDSFMSYVYDAWEPGIGPVLSNDDWSFLGHHILTGLYMMSALWIRAGHMSAMILMFFGELSNPFMNLTPILENSLLMQKSCHSYRTMAPCLPIIIAYNEQLFSYIYLICRVGFAPFVMPHLSYDLLFTIKGRRNVPLWLSICWMFMCWGVQLGSLPWIMTCIETVKRGPVFRSSFEHNEL